MQQSRIIPWDISLPRSASPVSVTRTPPRARAHWMMPGSAATKRTDALTTDPVVLVEDAVTQRRSPLQWVLMGLGLVLLAALVYGAGPRRLAEHLQTIGWWTPVIFLPYAIASAFD